MLLKEGKYKWANEVKIHNQIEQLGYGDNMSKGLYKRHPENPHWTHRHPTKVSVVSSVRNIKKEQNKKRKLIQNPKTQSPKIMIEVIIHKLCCL